MKHTTQENRFQKQNELLVQLAKLQFVGSGELKTVLQHIVEAVAHTLFVERVSVWLFTNNRTAIRCIDLFELSKHQHSEGMVLKVQDYPAYFEALERERVIVAYEARQDPRTKQFTRTYLEPFGIYSMLDVPIHFGGQITGVVCHEHIGNIRYWSRDDESFASAVADLISLALESAERRKMEMLNNAVYRIAEATETVLELDDLFKAIHTIISTVMPANNFYIALYDDDEDIVSFPYFVDEVDTPPQPRQRAKGLTEYVLRTGKPLLCTEEVFNILLSKSEVESIGEPSRIWLGVPLKIENETIGVMVVQHYKDPHAYGESELHMLEYVSSQIAKAITHKRNEVKIKKTLSLLEATLESTADGILVVDRFGKIVSYNKQFVEMWHIPEEIIASKDDEQAINSVLSQLSDPESFIKKVRELYAQPSLSSFDVLHFKDGRIFERYSQPQTIGEEIVGRVWSFRDVTKRMRTEELNRLLAKAVESATDLITVTDLENRFVFVNKHFLQVYGYEEHEILGQTPHILVPPHEAERVVNQIFETINNKGRWEGELINRKKDGTEFYIHLSSSAIKNEQGNITMYVGVSQDITEKKKAEMALRLSEEHYRTLVESALDAIFRLSPTGLIESLNSAFERITGWSREEWIGKSFTTIIHQDDFAKVQNLFKMTIEGKSTPIFELRIQPKEGNYILTEGRMTALYQNNTVVGVLGIARDITERKKLEEEIHKIQRMESLGTLAAGVAHSFNNILDIIQGYIVTLEDHLSKQYDQQFDKSINTIKKAIERGTNIVQQILTYAHKTEVDFQALSLNLLIEEIVKLLEETFPKTIDIKCNMTNEPTFISGDVNKIHQSLLSICVNARDAMPNGGTLTISTSVIDGIALREYFHDATEHKYVCISINDTGVGMDDATRSRIFDPFFTTKDFGSGIGLGLSMVYGTVKSHRAFVDIESQVGKGSTFKLYFPVINVAADNEALVVTEKEGAVKRGSETILIVEDEDALRELLKGLLEDNGYQVMEAADGQEAVKIYTQNKDNIGLVFSDMGLPKLGGWEAFQKIKEVNPNVKAILASGYFSHELRTKMINEGAKDFVQKPYALNSLLSRIREILDGKED